MKSHKLQDGYSITFEEDVPIDCIHNEPLFSELTHTKGLIDTYPEESILRILWLG